MLSSGPGAELYWHDDIIADKDWTMVDPIELNNTPSPSDGLVAPLVSQKSSSPASDAPTTLTDRGSHYPESSVTTAPTDQPSNDDPASPRLGSPLTVTATSLHDSPAIIRSRRDPRDLKTYGKKNKMPFRQRFTRHLGESVSKSEFTSRTLLPIGPSTFYSTPSVAGLDGAGSRGKQQSYATKSATKRSGGYIRNSVLFRDHTQNAIPKKRYREYSSPVGFRTSSGLTPRSSKQLSPEHKFLSYYDVNLTNEDIKALKNDWLTDNNICFWEEWLEREVLPKYPQARISLLRPSMSLVLMVEKTEISRTQLPDFRHVTHIFVPITDVKDLERAEGGTHWSLLLVSTLDGVAFHYDSLGTANIMEARMATKRLAELLGNHLRFQNIDDCPQQENGNDCGVFVCILMRHLLVKRLLNANAREKVSMSMHNKMIDAAGGRKEMLKIIDNLRKEGERRRSTSPFTKAEAPRIE